MLLFLAIPVWEIVVSIRWNERYYKSGFLVFRRLFLKKLINDKAISEYYIEKLLSKNGYGRISFHRSVRDNFFLFKENGVRVYKGGINYVFLPVLHGNLTIDPEKGEVLMVGRLNWSIVLIIMFFSILLFHGMGYRVVAFFSAILIITYLYQVMVFYKIADILEKNLEI